MHQAVPNDGADAGARLAIRLLQDAAERGDLDPWDVDVIAVVDGFLDQLRQRIDCLLYTSPSPRDATLSRMPSSA